MTDLGAVMGSASLPTVLVVEDHDLMRDLIASTLSRTGEFHVGAAVGSVQAARTHIRTAVPDIVVIDHYLPDGTGFDILRDAKNAAPGVRTVVVTGNDDPDLVLRYAELGICGFAYKTGTSASFMRVMRAVASGETAFDEDATRTLLAYADGTHDGRRSPLSPREREVLVLVAQGLSDSEIADGLNLSSETVKADLSQVGVKLGVTSRADAVTTGIREGIVH
jgi:DNA-binding NarL/FixJ family response regulator